MTKKGLYILSVMGCMGGYIWLFLSSAGFNSGVEMGCLFKRAFHIPCPSCGSTRAILLLIHGQIKDSFLLNPLGFLLATILVVAPVWMLGDWLLKRDSYYVFYTKIDKLLLGRGVFLLFICLMVVNWIWNITKEL